MAACRLPSCATFSYSRCIQLLLRFLPPSFCTSPSPPSACPSVCLFQFDHLSLSFLIRCRLFAPPSLIFLLILSLFLSHTLHFWVSLSRFGFFSLSLFLALPHSFHLALSLMFWLFLAFAFSSFPSISTERNTIRPSQLPACHSLTSATHTDVTTGSAEAEKVLGADLTCLCIAYNQQGNKSE